jgi:hypothetical protein
VIAQEEQRRQSDRLDALPSQCRAEGCGIFGISIHNQESRVPKERLLGIGEIAHHLHHPDFVRTRGDSRNQAYPASVDSIPTSANQEDHVSMAAHGARRLLPMVENVMAVIAIELLAAAQACDFHAPLASSPPLEAVRATLRQRVSTLNDDRYLHPDLEAAISLVRDGAVTAAAGLQLPALCEGAA